MINGTRTCGVLKHAMCMDPAQHHPPPYPPLPHLVLPHLEHVDGGLQAGAVPPAGLQLLLSLLHPFLQAGRFLLQPDLPAACLQHLLFQSHHLRRQALHQHILRCRTHFLQKEQGNCRTHFSKKKGQLQNPLSHTKRASAEPIFSKKKGQLQNPSCPERKGQERSEVAEGNVNVLENTYHSDVLGS